MSKHYKGEQTERQESTLSLAMGNILDEVTANGKYPLPEGYKYELIKYISYELIYDHLIRCGYDVSDFEWLLNKNPGGGYASINPDGGILAAVKRDYGGNVKNIFFMPCSEAKYQKSREGNAIERMFKNYNLLQLLYYNESIFPYVVLCEGKGLSSSFEQNKVMGGCQHNLTDTVDGINVNCKYLKHNNGCNKQYHSTVFMREEPFSYQETYDIVKRAFEQTYDYYKKEYFDKIM